MFFHFQHRIKCQLTWELCCYWICITRTAFSVLVLLQGWLKPSFKISFSRNISLLWKGTAISTDLVYYFYCHSDKIKFCRIKLNLKLNSLVKLSCFQLVIFTDLINNFYRHQPISFWPNRAWSFVSLVKLAYCEGKFNPPLLTPLTKFN